METENEYIEIEAKLYKKYTSAIKIKGYVISTLDKPIVTPYEYVVLNGLKSADDRLEWKIKVIRMDRKLGIGFVNSYESVTRKSIDNSAELFDLENRGKWLPNTKQIPTPVSNKIPITKNGDIIKVKVSKSTSSLILTFLSHFKQDFQFRLNSPITDEIFPIIVFHGSANSVEIII